MPSHYVGGMVSRPARTHLHCRCRCRVVNALLTSDHESLSLVAHVVRATFFHHHTLPNPMLAIIVIRHLYPPHGSRHGRRRCLVACHIAVGSSRGQGSPIPSTIRGFNVRGTSGIGYRGWTRGVETRGGTIAHVRSYDRDMITRVTGIRLLVVTLQFLD